jgi:hypothetical protein
MQDSSQSLPYWDFQGRATRSLLCGCAVIQLCATKQISAKRKKEFALTPEAIAAISSATIALCALGITVWQARIARRHNKLSVRPHLTTRIDSDPTNHVYSADLLNKGIGPALIKSFSIFVDGCAVGGEESESIKNAVEILFPKNVYALTHTHVPVGSGLAANETIKLVSIQFAGQLVPSSKEVNDAIRRTRLLIHYSSMYEELFVLGGDESKAS